MENNRRIGRVTPLGYEKTPKLDKRDRKILSALMQNCRLNASTIAKVLHASKSTVGFKIKRMERLGIIEGYQTYLNPYQLGYSIAVIFIKSRHLRTEDSFMEGAAKISNTLSVISQGGEWDFIVFFYYKSLNEADEILRNVLGLADFKDYEVLEMKDIIFTPLDYTGEIVSIERSISKKDSSFWKDFGVHEKMKLDENDWKLLKIVANNAALSFSEIAKRTRLSREIVRYRLRKMVRCGIIAKFQAAVNPFAVHYEPFVLKIQLKDPSKFKEIETFIASTYKCNDIGRLFGRWNLIAFMHFSSLEELRAFEKELINRFEDVYSNYVFEPIREQSKLDWFPENR